MPQSNYCVLPFDFNVRGRKMPVVLIVTSRTWTSVNATELNDHILNDGVFEGPTYITRDELGIPPGEMNLYKSLNVHCVRDQTYSTSLKVATVLSTYSQKKGDQSDQLTSFVSPHRPLFIVRLSDYFPSWLRCWHVWEGPLFSRRLSNGLPLGVDSS